ncbi:hypothetical protein PoB_004598600 [Plakobranchus ocellatus]|uniref:Uncharacterized protein n=1 Tax=Plakobranchus ocellatus TaxID=259542 RepID=A0AAV4B7W9_9GAST|nr:hypothetical protein PoB_004598600 [Plakobranchus ocellatus]
MTTPFVIGRRIHRDGFQAQDPGNNVTSQFMTTEILDIPTGPSSPTAAPSADDVEGPVSSGESEHNMASLSPSENHRVAQRFKKIKSHRLEAAESQLGDVQI